MICSCRLGHWKDALVTLLMEEFVVREKRGDLHGQRSRRCEKILEGPWSDKVEWKNVFRDMWHKLKCAVRLIESFERSRRKERIVTKEKKRGKETRPLGFLEM